MSFIKCYMDFFLYIIPIPSVLYSKGTSIKVMDLNI